MKDSKRLKRKNKLAAPGRFYGGTGTLHADTELDVEVCNGRVIGVWFRCVPLPFRQIDIDAFRAAEIPQAGLPLITGVELLDPITPGGPLVPEPHL